MEEVFLGTLFLLTCVNVLLAYMSVHHLYAWYSQRPEESIRPPRTVVNRWFLDTMWVLGIFLHHHSLNIYFTVMKYNNSLPEDLGSCSSTHMAAHKQLITPAQRHLMLFSSL